MNSVLLRQNVVERSGKWESQNFRLISRYIENVASQQTDYLKNVRLNITQDKISEFGNDQKRLFKLTNSLLGNTNTVVLPSHQSETELANRFGSYFLSKIETIRTNLSKVNKDLGNVDPLIADTPFDGHPLNCLHSRFYRRGTKNHTESSE